MRVGGGIEDAAKNHEERGLKRVSLNPPEQGIFIQCVEQLSVLVGELAQGEIVIEHLNRVVHLDKHQIEDTPVFFVSHEKDPSSTPVSFFKAIGFKNI